MERFYQTTDCQLLEEDGGMALLISKRVLGQGPRVDFESGR